MKTPGRKEASRVGYVVGNIRQALCRNRPVKIEYLAKHCRSGRKNGLAVGNEAHAADTFGGSGSFLPVDAAFGLTI